MPELKSEDTIPLSRRLWLDAALVGLAIFLWALFGIFTRPVGHLAAFWPANALLLGMMIRYPGLANPRTILCAIIGYLAADLLTGSILVKTMLLTGANLAGVMAGYFLFSRVGEEHRRLRQPLSVLYLILISAAAGCAVGIVGAIANPLLFDGDPLSGWIFWFVTELVNYIAILPVILTTPPWHWLRRWQGRDRRQPATGSKPANLAPLLALGLSFLVGITIGGPGAVAFPVPALLWCAITYRLFVTALLSLGYSAWTLLSIAFNLVPAFADTNTTPVVLSLRVGVALVALAPLVVGSVMATMGDLMDRLRHTAAHDPLTGLPNRQAFAERARALLARLSTGGRPLAVMMLDIDRFKVINDTYGHAAGDKVLIVFAQHLRRQLRDADVVGRLGGEEFAVALAEAGGDTASIVADRIREGFANLAIDLGDGQSISATVSIGIATAADAPGAFEVLLALADQALYRAKQGGRNRAETSLFSSF